MSIISFIGNNLNIGIYTETTVRHNWQTFALWYSVQHFLPDANVFIIAKRNPHATPYIFTWATKLNVKRFRSVPDLFPLMLLTPDTIVLRDFEEDVDAINNTAAGVFSGGFFYRSKEDLQQPATPLPISVETPSEIIKPIALYKGRCGDFDVTTWKKTTPPFENASLFNPRSFAEKKILEMWGKMFGVYKFTNMTDNYKLGNYFTT